MFQKSCRNVSSATFVHKSFMQMFQKRFTNVSTKLSFSNVSIEMFQKCVSHVSTKLFNNYKLHGKCFRPVSETFITKLLKDGHFHISTTVRKCFWHFYWNVSKFQNTRGRNVSDTFRAMWAWRNRFKAFTSSTLGTGASNFLISLTSRGKGARTASCTIWAYRGPRNELQRQRPSLHQVIYHSLKRQSVEVADMLFATPQLICLNYIITIVIL